MGKCSLCVSDSCPVLPRSSWSKSGREEAPKPASVPAPSTTVAGDVDTTSRTGWAMKLWRRGSSQERPLRPASSYSSENSYTEEPYVHPDAQSAVYAELAQGLNTYSEIPDPGGLLQHRLVVSDYGYGNSAYALSEAPSEPAESSSTPSSAYYSDVSTDARTSKKKRKKKKNNDKDGTAMQNCNFSNIHANISSNVPIISPRMSDGLHVALSSEETRLGSAAHDTLPLSLRFLPLSYTLERQGMTYACSPCQSCTPISTLPIIRHPCELPNMVLNASNRSLATHILPGSEPTVKYAVRTTASHVIHDKRSHFTTHANNVNCSQHSQQRLQAALHSEPMICRQEQPLPCPPSEYV